MCDFVKQCQVKIEAQRSDKSLQEEASLLSMESSLTLRSPIFLYVFMVILRT